MNFEHDFEPEQKPGCKVAPDDIEVGQHYCIHSCKCGEDHILPAAGQSFKVKAIQYPYFVVTFVGDPSQAPTTLDVRVFDFMKVSPEFVAAQIPSQAQPEHLAAILRAFGGQK